ncbi:MAG: hypothetical protein ACE5JM_16765, partial [Armatimonadota bacterium]
MSLLLVSGLLVGLGTRAAMALVYCNVTDVQAKAMTNGVQITVVADGILRWEWESKAAEAEKGKVTRIGLRLQNARSKIDKTFINIGETPVSHVQISVPRDAEEGVGLIFVVTLTEPSTFDVELSRDQQALIITVHSERT